MLTRDWFDAGGDLGRRADQAGNIVELAKLCNADLDCSSFQTDGFLKKNTKDNLDFKDDWKKSCNGIYSKSPKECPQEEKIAQENGFTFLATFDLNGK